MLTSPAIAEFLDRAVQRLPGIRDQLNEADSRLGDGDTGMTVARVMEAMRAASVGLPADTGQALAVVARAASQASGSSLASVVTIGLMAAAKTARGRETVDRAGVAALLQVAIDAITARSGAGLGDKTVLDSLDAIRAELAGHDPAAPDTGTGVAAPDTGTGVAADAARRALCAFRDRPSKLGRARVYGDRSIGFDDPGMLAACLILDAAAGR
ncbi:dihydroxyacetone kinase subunit L [Azospirillum sp. RWY-5-1]|uniref:Dihydroxyacetone kinase subunit L n=1 Tax=Azospirillum oleiclasticum TaxID=2735135 RepID=A0ABX2TCJ9_9PROT|nr:dihydroxyacetone kinase subunit L [Azospirillum oleiclasticum]NYZ13945.1 dihydroxyacetone kinase subunit L [Azospirillum oleiclasticum]NYZ20868.1 dihydroxyacetone kinase subunit L [Azospirillum oleiclasticum]